MSRYDYREWVLLLGKPSWTETEFERIKLTVREKPHWIQRKFPGSLCVSCGKVFAEDVSECESCGRLCIEKDNLPEFVLMSWNLRAKLTYQHSKYFRLLEIFKENGARFCHPIKSKGRQNGQTPYTDVMRTASEFKEFKSRDVRKKVDEILTLTNVHGHKVVDGKPVFPSSRKRSRSSSLEWYNTGSSKDKTQAERSSPKGRETSPDNGIALRRQTQPSPNHYRPVEKTEYKGSNAVTIEPRFFENMDRKRMIDPQTVYKHYLHRDFPRSKIDDEDIDRSWKQELAKPFNDKIVGWTQEAFAHNLAVSAFRKEFH